NGRYFLGIELGSRRKPPFPARGPPATIAARKPHRKRANGRPGAIVTRTIPVIDTFSQIFRPRSADTLCGRHDSAGKRQPQCAARIGPLAPLLHPFRGERAMLTRWHRSYALGTTLLLTAVLA